ncbi:DUF488 domain-containing protein [Aneurinibacillus tyrosinisolvens]|uniref:DUF488 domain-containing protein n=1 Tax=Aneurinibacillus tyrosinisolvens TaxID=1443435 RepID=UPI00063F512B|nr:DUF488 domain-containing protein [Aneurinibacillus tyrosinisolvens]
MSKKHPTPPGKLYTTNPAGLKNLKVEAELWQITRAGYDLPDTVIVKNLSPSPELFKRFIRSWKGKPPKEWWPEYENLFSKELETDEKIRSLRDVYKKLLQGKNVVLICFCADHRYCHRRLVGEFFLPYGVKAEELNPVLVEQITLF